LIKYRWKTIVSPVKGKENNSIHTVKTTNVPIFKFKSWSLSRTLSNNGRMYLNRCSDSNTDCLINALLHCLIRRSLRYLSPRLLQKNIINSTGRCSRRKVFCKCLKFRVSNNIAHEITSPTLYTVIWLREALVRIDRLFIYIELQYIITSLQKVALIYLA
jgi:hypothetical protein